MERVATVRVASEVASVVEDLAAVIVDGVPTNSSRGPIGQGQTADEIIATLTPELAPTYPDASRLAGLHLHFFLRTLELARAGDLGCFVAAAEWLDVNYGAALRWLLIGPISVQPSELFKLCFVLMVVWFLSTRWAQPVGKTVLVAAAPLALVPAVLIVKQPDLGTALLLFPVLIALLVAAGMRLRILGGLVLMGLAAAPVERCSDLR